MLQRFFRGLGLWHPQGPEAHQVDHTNAASSSQSLSSSLKFSASSTTTLNTPSLTSESSKHHVISQVQEPGKFGQLLRCIYCDLLLSILGTMPAPLFILNYYSSTILLAQDDAAFLHEVALLRKLRNAGFSLAEAVELLPALVKRNPVPSSAIPSSMTTAHPQGLHSSSTAGILSTTTHPSAPVLANASQSKAIPLPADHTQADLGLSYILSLLPSL